MSKKMIIWMIVLGLAVVFILATAPSWVGSFNQWRFDMQTVHDQTDYKTLRMVEDTARAMIASYHSDLLIFEQFRDSELQEERNWANNARIRANRTASTYNNFILENSFVWAFGVPEDIAEALSFLN